MHTFFKNQASLGTDEPCLALRRAQKKALIRYHPDRHHGATMEAQVEAEEIFKIISDGVL